MCAGGHPWEPQQPPQIDNTPNAAEIDDGRTADWRKFEEKLAARSNMAQISGL